MPRSRFCEPLASNPLIDRAPVKPFDPVACQAAVARSAGQGRQDAYASIPALIALPFAGSRPCRRSLALEGSEHGGRVKAFRDGGPRVTIHRAIAMLSACTLLALSVAAGAAEAPPRSFPSLRSADAGSSTGDWSAHVREAAKRFATPERWIRAVIHVESGSDVHAVSSKGAMGLMQIMPATWEELRTKHALGDDPFDPRDNILAGTAYLREMLDRFGKSGFLAAYNAGPARYEQHVATGRPLPAETLAYVRKLTPLLFGREPFRQSQHRSGIARDIPGSPLFFLARARSALLSQRSDAPPEAVDPPPDSSPVGDRTALEPQPASSAGDMFPDALRRADALFVTRSSRRQP